MPGKRLHPAVASAAPDALAPSPDVACCHRVAVRGCGKCGMRWAKLPRSSNGAAVAVHHLTALHSPTAADGRPVGVGAEPGANQRQDAAAEVRRLADAAKKDKQAEAACQKAAKSLQRWAGHDLVRQLCFVQVEVSVRSLKLKIGEPISAAMVLAAAQIQRKLAVIRAKTRAWPSRS